MDVQDHCTPIEFLDLPLQLHDLRYYRLIQRRLVAAKGIRCFESEYPRISQKSELEIR